MHAMQCGCVSAPAGRDWKHVVLCMRLKCLILHMLQPLAGNGSQWPLMAADLLESSRVFRSAIEACARALQPKGVDLMAEFSSPEGWSTPALAMAGLSAIQARSVLVLAGQVGF